MLDLKDESEEPPEADIDVEPDEEFLDRTMKFIKKNTEAKKPWFAWVATSRMHFYTHLKPESEGVTGLGIFADGMVEHDGHVGQMLDLLEKLKIDDNTIVIYTVDNGPHYNEWPDGGISPFRGEKNTNWEGGWRVPAMVRWPGNIKPGSISNEIMSGLDWFPTVVAAAGDADIKNKLLKGHKAGDKTFKVHLDGYNFLPHLTGKEKEGPRKEIFYFSDDGALTALRHGDWKLIFMEQRATGTLQVWSEPFVPLRVPKMFNLRQDPYELADVTSNTYWDWVLDHVFFMVPAQAYVADFLMTFKEFPPRQKPASFSIDQVMEMMVPPTN